MQFDKFFLKSKKYQVLLNPIQTRPVLHYINSIFLLFKQFVFYIHLSNYTTSREILTIKTPSKIGSKVTFKYGPFLKIQKEIWLLLKVKS